MFLANDAQQHSRQRFSVVGGVVNPLQTLNGRHVLSKGRRGRSQGGRRIPRRAEVVLSEATIKEHVSGGGINILVVILTAATDNRKCVDRLPHVDQAPRASLRNGGQ